jgi:hypothetical protein
MPKVEKNESNLKACACPNCPSYNDCARAKVETLYCSDEVGLSACPYKMNGCICMACPVHANNNLKAGYYCLKSQTE